MTRSKWSGPNNSVKVRIPAAGLRPSPMTLGHKMKIITAILLVAASTAVAQVVSNVTLRESAVIIFRVVPAESAHTVNTKMGTGMLRQEMSIINGSNIYDRALTALRWQIQDTTGITFYVTGSSEGDRISLSANSSRPEKAEAFVNEKARQYIAYRESHPLILTNGVNVEIRLFQQASR